MKLHLTINDASPEEISKFLSAWNTIQGTGSTIHTTGVLTVADDDTGPQNPNAPTVDSAGYPWDERIHSKTKVVKDDGTWRKRRGVDDATIAAVETEIRSRAGTGAPPQQPVFTPPPQQPVFTPPPQQPVFTPPPQQPVFTPPPQQPVFTPPPQQPVFTPPPQPTAALDFNGFMLHLTQNMQAKSITVDYLTTVCQRITASTGAPFNSITDLQARPDIISLAVWIMTQDGKW